MIPATFATLTELELTLNAAPPALSTEVVVDVFNNSIFSFSVIVPWFVPATLLTTVIDVLAAPVAPAMLHSLVVLNSYVPSFV